jgi:hypothetical protein
MNGSVNRVRSFVCISDDEVKDAINLNLDVVARDGLLLTNVEHLLF